MKHLARALRKQQTDAEKLLWQSLRNRGFLGLKFRRQQLVGSYIVDFLCLEPKLVIELDGGQHHAQQEHDAMRIRYLESLGYQLLRFWNHEVLLERTAVLESIGYALLLMPSPQPSPGGRGSTAALVVKPQT